MSRVTESVMDGYSGRDRRFTKQERDTFDEFMRLLEKSQGTATEERANNYLALADWLEETARPITAQAWRDIGLGILHRLNPT